MEERNEISKAFIEFQKEMPEIKLDSTVKVKTKTGGEYKFKYATLANIFKHVLPVLSKNGLGITQTFQEVSSGTCLVTILIHTSGQSWASAISIDVTSGTMQEIGSRISYLKRYEAAAILGIVAEEDDDANIASGNTYRREDKLKEPMPKSEKQDKTGEGKAGDKKTLIDKVIKKEDIGKNGKPYTKYTIIDSNGVKYSTFSDTFAKIAIEARELKAEVIIDSKKPEKPMWAHDLISIKIKTEEDDLIPPELQPTLDIGEEKDRILDLLREYGDVDVRVMCIEATGKTPDMEWDMADIGRVKAYVKLQEEIKKQKNK
ncbi:MAG TPA: ERF family protein [Candidatus Wunengus sp. YC61]|uniref:ERF family protein n=1 Tax=Candidatus Wunengus sp. YC61 TaxID=3367698 RepID=UPI004025F79B